METEVIQILNSLDQRDQRFRDQVKRLRDFRAKLVTSGSNVEAEPYSIPLMGRIEPPHQRTLGLLPRIEPK